ncbi:MAG: cation:proton antiporter, partial [Thermoguttaceae bacterium]|nr:cation:proton antiporter [Thermoguttaceae bacterium]
MVEDLHIFHTVALIALLLFLGIFASKISSWIKIPTLLMIMLVGMLAGTDGLGQIPFNDFTEAAHLGTIALLFILFSGGYDTNWKAIRKVIVPGTVLCTVGVA